MFSDSTKGKTKGFNVGRESGKTSGEGSLRAGPHMRKSILVGEHHTGDF